MDMVIRYGRTEPAPLAYSILSRKHVTFIIHNQTLYASPVYIMIIYVHTDTWEWYLFFKLKSVQLTLKHPIISTLSVLMLNMCTVR